MSASASCVRVPLFALAPMLAIAQKVEFV